jgi:type III pantothenate kinase
VLLALDIRNRSLSLGFFEKAQAEGQPRARWLSRHRLGLVPGRGADEYALLLRGLAAEARGGEAGLGLGGAPRRGEALEAAWMSSVVPSLTRELARATELAFGLAPSLIGPGVKTGVKIRTDVPSEVGSDLICEAAAARELVGGACVVVDFDAAIAFSAVGKTGDFLGAAIAPGLGVAADSLRAVAALLPEVALNLGSPGYADEKNPAIGKNTAQSVRAGIGLGYAGLVERIVRRQREELAAMGEASGAEAVAVLGTGQEEGRALLASLDLGRFYPELVLEGIAIIAFRATPSARVLV